MVIIDYVSVHYNTNDPGYVTRETSISLQGLSPALHITRKDALRDCFGVAYLILPFQRPVAPLKQHERLRPQNEQGGDLHE